MVILTVLAAIVVPKFTSRSEAAKVTAAKTQIGSFDQALDLMEVDVGRYPTTDEGLQALMQLSNVPSWKGPYLKRAIPKDPWSHDYIYRCPGQHNTSGYDLYSWGPDGREGGGDDVDNWSQQ
jgi:general secretion pathway protein G